MWLRICDTCNSYVNVYSSGGTAKVRSVVPLWFLAPFFVVVDLQAQLNEAVIWCHGH